MSSIWDKIKKIFIKKHKQEIVLTFEQQELVYKGEEEKCWACGFPIHRIHKARKLNAKRVHTKCYKILKRILFSDGSLNAF